MKPNNFLDVIKEIASKLEGKQYAIRGTASLVLQGINMNVEDIDIICDSKTSLQFNKLFETNIVKEVKFSESEKFKSYFGEFKINDIKVEIMGEWQIKNKKGEWSRVFDAKDASVIEIDGQKVKVTSIETELEMFALMRRWNAYNKIKNAVSSQQSLL